MELGMAIWKMYSLPCSTAWLSTPSTPWAEQVCCSTTLICTPGTLVIFNQTCFTALHMAAANDHADVAARLLEAGAVR